MPTAQTKAIKMTIQRGLLAEDLLRGAMIQVYMAVRRNGRTSQSTFSKLHLCNHPVSLSWQNCPRTPKTFLRSWISLTQGLGLPSSWGDLAGVQETKSRRNFLGLEEQRGERSTAVNDGGRGVRWKGGETGFTTLLLLKHRNLPLVGGVIAAVI